MYDVWIYLVVSESEIIGGDGCDVTDTLGTVAVSETTLRAGAGWGTTTVDCGVNYNGNLDRGEVGVSGIKIDCGSGISWPTIVAICFISFCLFSPNKS